MSPEGETRTNRFAATYSTAHFIAPAQGAGPHRVGSAPRGCLQKLSDEADVQYWATRGIRNGRLSSFKIRTSRLPLLRSLAAFWTADKGSALGLSRNHAVEQEATEEAERQARVAVRDLRVGKRLLNGGELRVYVAYRPGRLQ